MYDYSVNYIGPYPYRKYKFDMKTLKSGNFKNKRVLVRCDFNVGMDDTGKITDDYRIAKALPTIKFLAKSGAVVVLMSHLEKDGRVVSLEAVAERLGKLL